MLDPQQLQDSDDWGSGIPWFRSREKTMRWYVKYWRKADVAFDLFGGGASALPWLSPRYKSIHFSDLAAESTFLLSWLKKNQDKIPLLREEMSRIAFSFMGRELADQSRLARKLFDTYTVEEERQEADPLHLAALPLILGYFLYNGKQGVRWFPGFKKRSRSNSNLSDRLIEINLKRALTNLDKFLHYIDLDRITVHRADYRRVLKVHCLPYLDQGKKVFIWADLPFPMEDRGAKDNRVKNQDETITRAQYRHDFFMADHIQFFREIQPYIDRGAIVIIPSFSNETYDRILGDKGWHKYFLAKQPGFAGLSNQFYYYNAEPNSGTEEEKPKKRKVVQRVEFSKEGALQYLEEYTDDESYKAAIRPLLQQLPTLHKSEAPRDAAPVKNKSFFWARCKEVVYTSPYK